jgi:putative oxidoreductase
MTMFRKLIATENDRMLAIMRLLLGAIFFAHGAQKMLGWFGGFGYTGTMAAFTHQMGIPAGLATLAIAAEFFGAIALIFGLGGRLAALGISTIMLVAVFKVHLQNGFFMNWYGNQKGEGFEYHLLVLAIGLLLMLRGSGAWSIDRALAFRLRRAQAPRLLEPQRQAA